MAFCVGKKELLSKKPYLYKKKKVKIIILSDTLKNKLLRKKDIQDIHTSDHGSHFGVWVCLIIYKTLLKLEKVENP